ncbi:MAG: response regulator, partial [Porphyrobacter sp.]|nr:response regulator [Porphyrobacter sp.]
SPAPSATIADDRDELEGAAFVLIVEDDPTFAGVLLDIAHDASIKGVISSAGSGTLSLVRKLRPSAITLDLGLSDIDGFVLLDLLRHDPESCDIPVYVISGAEQADHALTLGAERVIEKPAERSELAELFTGIAEKFLQQGPRKSRKPARRKSGQPAPALPLELAGKRLLIVDDDIRNIYSLASVLETHGAEVLHAERGAEGIALLEQHPDIDVALIDIMMPEMDGYETMRRIRANPRLAHIPLISVTAKAMKGDRQKCLDAGASDYIAKPVDIDLLLALLRVWIGRSQAGAPDPSLIVVESAA